MSDKKATLTDEEEDAIIEQFAGFEPFRVHRDSVNGKWVCITSAPDDDEDFVVPYETDSESDAWTVCDALNNVMQKHLRDFVEKREEKR